MYLVQVDTLMTTPGEVSLASQFLIGVLSGVVAALVIFLFSRVWVRDIVPWYEDRLYHDARVEGRWEGLLHHRRTGQARRHLVEIQRQGHDVEGTMTVLEGPEDGRVWKFKGTFRNLIMCCTYESTDQALLDRGSFSLMLTTNGDRLAGTFSYYEDTNHRIETLQALWSRKGSLHEIELEAVDDEAVDDEAVDDEAVDDEAVDDEEKLRDT